MLRCNTGLTATLHYHHTSKTLLIVSFIIKLWCEPLQNIVALQSTQPTCKLLKLILFAKSLSQFVLHASVFLHESMVEYFCSPTGVNCFFYQAFMFVLANKHNLHAAGQLSIINPLFVSHSFTDVQNAHSSCSFLLPKIEKEKSKGLSHDTTTIPTSL